MILAFGLVGGVLRYVVDHPNSGFGGGQPPPPELEAALGEIFSTSTCHAPAQSVEAVGTELRRLGYTTWRVDLAQDVSPADCVSSVIDTEQSRVLLIAGLRPDVKVALDAMAERLLTDCLSKDDALALLDATLGTVNLSGYLLRTDGGVMGPIERMDEVRQHVADGCWIYSGTGRDASGVRIFWVGGR